MSAPGPEARLGSTPGAGRVIDAGVQRWPAMAFALALGCAAASLLLFVFAPNVRLLAGVMLGAGIVGVVAALTLRRFVGRLGAHESEIADLKAAAGRQAMQSASQIADADARYEALVEAMDALPVGVFRTTDDGTITYVNATLARWMGRSSADIVASNVTLRAVCSDDTPPPDHGVGSVDLATIDNNRVGAYVMRSRSGDGDGTNGVILRDPGTDAETHAETGRDVTTDADEFDRNSTAEGPLMPSWLFEDAPIGMAILSAGGEIMSANAALGRFLGVRAPELKGTRITDHIAPEDRDELGAALSKLVLGARRAVHASVRLPSAGDHVDRAASFYASLAGPVEEDAEAPIVLHVIDETEHRHLEVQFAQSQKMQAIGQLAGGVAHDFNNLLTAMIGFCDLLLQRHGPDDPSFADIMQIQQNANRATNLVRQLLAFSRKQTLEPVVIDPAEALGDLSHLLGRLLGETVDLRLQPAANVHLIRADRGQFDQVIINLAVNARDAMPGGGALSVAATNETVATAIRRGDQEMPPGAYVVIEVADTGTGIAKENLERIFEPFFSTKEVGAGTGLGLSTVYGIVRQSEGYIFVDSAVGHGTTFRIYLPAYGGEGQAARGVEGAEEAARDALARRRREQSEPVEEDGGDLTGDGVILLVEDEDAVRMFGSRALRNKGYTVLEAENGEVALDVINDTAYAIDLIVSDVIMPGMDGHTLVQLVRQELPDVKVILMSGYAEDVFRDEISRDSTIHFLAKPFSLKTLAGTVKAVIEGRQPG